MSETNTTNVAPVAPVAPATNPGIESAQQQVEQAAQLQRMVGVPQLATSGNSRNDPQKS
jgi:hypothetical protein